jgi:hypothetical protein
LELSDGYMRVRCGQRMDETRLDSRTKCKCKCCECCGCCGCCVGRFFGELFDAQRVNWGRVGHDSRACACAWDWESLGRPKARRQITKAPHTSHLPASPGQAFQALRSSFRPPPVPLSHTGIVHIVHIVRIVPAFSSPTEVTAVPRSPSPRTLLQVVSQLCTSKKPRELTGRTPVSAWRARPSLGWHLPWKPQRPHTLSWGRARRFTRGGLARHAT